jgi:hypothetical protein
MRLDRYGGWSASSSAVLGVEASIEGRLHPRGITSAEDDTNAENRREGDTGHYQLVDAHDGKNHADRGTEDEKGQLEGVVGETVDSSILRTEIQSDRRILSRHSLPLVPRGPLPLGEPVGAIEGRVAFGHQLERTHADVLAHTHPALAIRIAP